MVNLLWKNPVFSIVVRDEKGDLGGDEKGDIGGDEKGDLPIDKNL
jgi:hypothetical protein